MASFQGIGADEDDLGGMVGGVDGLGAQVVFLVKILEFPEAKRPAMESLPFAVTHLPADFAHTGSKIHEEPALIEIANHNTATSKIIPDALPDSLQGRRFPA